MLFISRFCCFSVKICNLQNPQTAVQMNKQPVFMFKDMNKL